MKTDKLLFSYPRRIECVPLVREDLVRELGSILSDVRLKDVSFLVSETFTNFLKHSSAEPQSIYKLEIDLSKTDIYLQIEYKDNKYQGIDPVKPDLETLPSSGFGLFMITKIADTFRTEYSRSRGVLVIYITLKRK